MADRPPLVNKMHYITLYYLYKHRPLEYIVPYCKPPFLSLVKFRPFGISLEYLEYLSVLTRTLCIFMSILCYKLGIYFSQTASNGSLADTCPGGPGV